MIRRALPRPAHAAWLAVLAVLALLPASPAHANWVASGTFQYVDRIYDGNGFTGATANLPIRKVIVQVMDQSTGAVLATGGTDMSGGFSINVTDAAARTVYVRALGYTQDSTLYRIKVRYSTSSAALYSVAGPSVASHGPNTDVTFNGGAPMVAPAGSVGEVFNIIDCLENGYDYVGWMNRQVRPTSVMLTIYWNLTSADGAYTSGNTIHLTGDDGYTDPVINHEEGHFMCARFSLDQSPGGTHYLGDNNEDLRLAWSEGWATYFGQSVRRHFGLSSTAWYCDLFSEAAAPGYNFSYELEGPSVGGVGGASEISVQAALWDIADDASTADDSPGVDDESLAMPDTSVWDVMKNYMTALPSGRYATVEGFWDGWFARGWAHQAEVIAAWQRETLEFYTDAGENDNFAAAARAVALDGTPAHRTFYGTGDVDWVKFTGTFGLTCVVETTGLVGGCDTQISIFGADTTGALATNNDRASGDPSSRITFTPPVAGSNTYYVKCTRVGGTYGRYGSYDLRVTQGTPTTAAFLDYTSTAGVGNSGGNSRGVAWGDYNNDGYPDLYVCNITAADRLFRGNGASFTDQAAAAGVQAGAAESHEGAAWGDYDNDGNLDLAVVSVDGIHLFRNNGGAPNNTFTEVTSAAGITFTGPGRTVDWVDSDGDGYLDLYLANYGVANRLLRNNGNGTFSAAVRGVEFSGHTLSAAWADFDGDGRPDLALGVDGTPSVRLYHQRSDGNFDDATSAAGMGGSAGSVFGLAWADANGDGRPDLVAANESGLNYLYLNQGNSTFAERAAACGVTGGQSASSPAWADVDDDGDLDLYVVNIGYAADLYDNLNGSSFSNSGLAATGLSSRAVAAADFNRDGSPDFYVASQAGNLLYRGTPISGRHYLELRLTGRTSNRSAIGARVMVKAGGRRMWREVSGGQAWGSQPSLVQHFGLGSATGADTVYVRWPSRRVSMLTGVAADQLLDVDESGSVVEVPADTPARLALGAATPNPFAGQTTLWFSVPAGPAEVRVRAEVFDVAGRLERVLLDANVPAGTTRTLAWDGRTASGAPAPPGVHFCRLVSGGRTLNRKLLLVH